MRRCGALLVLCLLAFAACARAPESRQPDNDGSPVRIVTLAPHLAELVFAAGAGDRLVGVSAYSDFPPAVADLPLVGDAFTIDQEQLRLLKPDVLLAWESGMPAHTLQELRDAGFPVMAVRTQRLEDIPVALLAIGELAGTSDIAAAEAERFSSALAAIQARYADRRPVTVFYQISSRPLYTVNGEHFISELIELCGGINIFADLNELAPAVDVEAVVSRRPETIIGSRSADLESAWSRFDTVPAVRDANLLLVDADHLGRASNRLDSAGLKLCEAIETARQRSHPR